MLEQDQDAIRTYQAEIHGCSAPEILRWALDRFGVAQIALASSLGAEDQVLTDLLFQIEPRARIFTLDTGRLPQETYDVLAATRQKYHCPIEVLFPERAAVEEMVTAHGPNLFYERVELRQLCCAVRKVEPLKRKLATLRAWICGLRKEQAASRENIAPVEWDAVHQLVKINPLCDWSAAEIWQYLREHHVPYNALHDQGYPSVGCAPCTRAVQPGEDPRAGRWYWETAQQPKECGLHVHEGERAEITTMPNITAQLNNKSNLLKDLLAQMERVLIAYSGGVDSTFLLKVAQEVLGEQVLAVTITSPVYPAEETAQAKAFAQQLGVRHEVLTADNLTQPYFVNNPPDRCYWCKKDLFTLLANLAQEHHLNYVLDGTNVDDLGDFRPGMKAVQELGVRSPLKEAGLTKAEIRVLAREFGLPIWNKPSLACLASRFPYGTRITPENLGQVGQAERFLWQAGFTQVRVRHHDNIARIEVLAADIPKLAGESFRRQFVAYLKELGYAYVTLDLEGYRTGSLNEVL